MRFEGHNPKSFTKAERKYLIKQLIKIPEPTFDHIKYLAHQLKTSPNSIEKWHKNRQRKIFRAGVETLDRPSSSVSADFNGSIPFGLEDHFVSYDVVNDNAEDDGFKPARQIFESDSIGSGNDSGFGSIGTISDEDSVGTNSENEFIGTITISDSDAIGTDSEADSIETISEDDSVETDSIVLSSYIKVEENQSPTTKSFQNPFGIQLSNFDPNLPKDEADFIAAFNDSRKNLFARLKKAF